MFANFPIKNVLYSINEIQNWNIFKVKKYNKLETRKVRQPKTLSSNCLPFPPELSTSDNG